MPLKSPTCPKCASVASIERSFAIGNSSIKKLSCGDFIRAEYFPRRSGYDIVSLDGKKLFPFQAEGIDFISSPLRAPDESKRGIRTLCADEMGLGKTVQALGTLALNEEQLLPALIVLKSALKVQWQHEFMRWLGEDYLAQVIDDGKTPLLKGFKGYIISYDMLRRIKDLSEQIKAAGIKTLIIDEVQQIKNPESDRARHLREISRDIPNIIALSGTPIKNNAAEYYSILNILHPEIFRHYSRFQYDWCDSYWDGYKYKTGGLKNPELFKRVTKDFIIRREYDEVKSQLPSATDEIQRRFTFHDLSKEVEKAYVATLKNFQDEYSHGDHSFAAEGSIIAFLSRMRHLTGISKIDPCIDFLMEFLGSTDRKIIVFYHHHDVRDMLRVKLDRLLLDMEDEGETLVFSAGDNSSDFVKKFKESKSRVALISTLAGGEGMDGLQHFVSDLIFLERQWNPANEEQAEKRVSQRIGQTHGVIGTYPIAVGTIDEFLSELVERKREIVTNTLGGEAVQWDQSSLMKDLAETLMVRGGQKWGF